jgi:hypothetical protein
VWSDDGALEEFVRRHVVRKGQCEVNETLCH